MRISVFPIIAMLALALVACATAESTGDPSEDSNVRPDVDEDHSRPDLAGDLSPDPSDDPSVDPQPDGSTDPQPDPTIDPGLDESQHDPVTDPPVDIPAEVQIECVADSACSAPNDTCAIYTSGTELGTECRPAVGAGGPGAACSADSECASGHCFYESFCLAPCATNEDCPETDETCQPFEFVLDDAGTPNVLTDDTTVTTSICLPDVGTMDPCVTIADCHVEEETCALIFDSLFSAERRCLYAVGAGQDGSCTDSAECQTNFCLSGGYCYWPCSSDATCTSGGDCTWITFIDAPGDDPTAPGCIPTCVSSEDCQDDEVCQAFLDDDPPNTLVQLCDAATAPGLLESGAPCANDAQCRSDYCSDYNAGDFRCVGPCDPVTDAGCATDTLCYENSIYYLFDNGTPFDYTDDVWASISTCLPDFGSYQTCGRDADCPSGETCSIAFFNYDMTGLEPRCVTPIGAAMHGGTCSVDSDCRSGWCDNDPEFGSFVCIGACQEATTATDCQSDTDCQTVIFTLPRNEASEADDIDVDVLICL